MGRDADVSLLLERWAQVKEGMGHVVVLSGEAGIGKSRLVQVVTEHIAGQPHVQWECRCSPITAACPGSPHRSLATGAAV